MGASRARFTRRAVSLRYQFLSASALVDSPRPSPVPMVEAFCAQAVGAHAATLPESIVTNCQRDAFNAPRGSSQSFIDSGVGSPRRSPGTIPPHGSSHAQESVVSGPQPWEYSVERARLLRDSDSLRGLSTRCSCSRPAVPTGPTIDWATLGSSRVSGSAEEVPASTSTSPPTAAPTADCNQQLFFRLGAGLAACPSFFASSSSQCPRSPLSESQC